MAINLQKGQRVALDSSLKYALVGLGWDTKKYSGGADFDLDASAFLLGEDDKLLRDEDFVFYNNLKGRGGAVTHTGDNLTGAGDGDDETIMIGFDKIPDEIKKIVICVTIHDAQTRHQNFGQVSNAYIHIAKMKSEFDTCGEEVLHYDLAEDYSVETSLIVAEIYRKDGGWKFNAVGQGIKGGLEALVRGFGGNV